MINKIFPCTEEGALAALKTMINLRVADSHVSVRETEEYGRYKVYFQSGVVLDVTLAGHYVGDDGVLSTENEYWEAL